MSSPLLILASASPRRSELLRQIGVEFSVAAQHIDESQTPGEAVSAYVCRLAQEKAEAALQPLADAEKGIVIAADTTVDCEDRILGKPQDREDALAMLNLLSANTHRVLSAVTVASKTQRHSALCESVVRFRFISTAEAAAYWATGEPSDKAGAYAIQGLAAVFVQSLTGSYSGVMGLPLFETAQLLEKFGVSMWQRSPE